MIEPASPVLSRAPRTGVVLLVIAFVVGGWLAWEIHRTIGLGAPRFWTLLREDRVFDIAMLDFLLTASWAFLVLVERANRKDWRFWVAMAAFMVIPSVGIGLYLVFKSGRSRDPETTVITPRQPDGTNPH